MKLLLVAFTFISIVFADYTGTWAYTVASPDGGVINANFEFSKVDGKYVGKITSTEGELPLKDLKIEGDKFSSNFNYQGYVVQLVGKFDGEVLNCTGSVEGYEFPIVAKKRKE